MIVYVISHRELHEGAEIVAITDSKEKLKAIVAEAEERYVKTAIDSIDVDEWEVQ